MLLSVKIDERMALTNNEKASGVSDRAGGAILYPAALAAPVAIGGGAAAMSGGKIGVITVIIAVISCAISICIYLFAKKIVCDKK